MDWSLAGAALDPAVGGCPALTAEDDPGSPSDDVPDLAVDCAGVVSAEVDSASEVPGSAGDWPGLAED